ncbi:DUF1254 domain-containing protein [Martelella alba]|uniref:DUF1254 domain-containing protein n=1 Tax=Martelella alba TaxID=2590451 RepID=A0A506U1L0_9HYPH|nr:DUF1254 domain-containing protein [Martelella alba]TPW28262.1 DUF1254 domain-containing protein [Martelella alba]
MSHFMRRIVLAAAVLLVAADVSAQDAPSPEEQEAYSIGMQAFIYGYPMIVMEKSHLGMTATKTVDSSRFMAPQGVWASASELAGPDMKYIQSTNNDTIYSWIWADLSEEPYVFVKPATGDRFYTTQFVDAFTNNFAYVSTRTDGPGKKTVALVGPGFAGKLPDGIERLEAPTDKVFVILRYGVDGEADMPNIKALQDASTFMPLSNFVAGTKPSAAPAPAKPDYSGDLADFEWIGDLMAANRPPADEAGLMGMFRRIGLGPDHGFEEDKLSDEQKAGLARAARDGLAAIEAAAKGTGHEVNGWQMPPVSNVFFANDYMLRAVVAWQSVFQNTPDEAYYPALYTGSKGAQLDGSSNSYVLRFEKGDLPPVNAFWSITLYDLKDRLMVANPINRYSIGDRTKGLVTGADGSLEIYIQAGDPGGEKSANWLPAPKGPFYLLMRAYLPKKAMLDGRYHPPAATVE